jgi:hypothetical protein
MKSCGKEYIVALYNSGICLMILWMWNFQFLQLCECENLVCVWFGGDNNWF